MLCKIKKYSSYYSSKIIKLVLVSSSLCSGGELQGNVSVTVGLQMLLITNLVTDVADVTSQLFKALWCVRMWSSTCCGRAR